MTGAFTEIRLTSAQDRPIGPPTAGGEGGLVSGPAQGPAGLGAEPSSMTNGQLLLWASAFILSGVPSGGGRELYSGDVAASVTS